MLIHIGANDMNGGQGEYKENDKPSNHDFIKPGYLKKYHKIYFIECIPSVYKILDKNLNYINSKFSKNYIPIQELVTSKSDEIKNFNIIGYKKKYIQKTNKHNAFASSSIYTPLYLLKKFPNLHVTKTIPIKSISFPDLIKKYNINIDKKFDLTLDTQGNELDILKGMNEYLKMVDILITEFTENKNHYLNGCKFKELDTFLKKNNFSLIQKDNKNHGNATYKNNNF